MILFADYNTPYLFAISFVLLIGLLEIFALICVDLPLYFQTPVIT